MSADKQQHQEAPPPFIALPTKGELKWTVFAGSLLLLLFCLVYGGCSWLTGLHTYRVNVNLPFEPLTSFYQSAAILYLSINVTMLLSFFILRSWRDMTPLVITMMAETLVAGVVFLLLPAANVFPERVATGFGEQLFHVTNALNLEHNFFPSLHVTFSFTFAVILGRRGGTVIRSLFLLWAVFVTASTMLLHEHYAADVLGGIVLAAVCIRVVYQRVNTPRFLDTLRVELICLSECWKFTRRHRRYLLVSLLLYRYSLCRWRRTRVMRTGFCFLQVVDDILDGDRKIEGAPGACIAALLDRIEAGSYEDSQLSTLARHFLEGLGPYVREDEDPRAMVFALMRVLMTDRERVEHRRLLTQQELDAHMFRTFELSLDILLISMEAEVRAADVPDLTHAFAWCSRTRDLREDLAKGLVNIPREVIDLHPGIDRNNTDFVALLDSGPVRQWLAEERQDILPVLERAGRQLDGLEGKSGVRICRIFHRSILDFANRRFARLYHEPLLQSDNITVWNNEYRTPNNE